MSIVVMSAQSHTSSSSMLTLYAVGTHDHVAILMYTCSSCTLAIPFMHHHVQGNILEDASAVAILSEAKKVGI
jgi:hypothetical protein